MAMDIYCIQEWGGGGGVSILIVCLFCSFKLSYFPPLLKEKYGFGCTSPHSLNLLTEMVHPLEVFQDFFQSGPTYHFCCMINTTTLRRTTKAI